MSGVAKMDDVNHLYFDNNFFGKLVCKPRSSSVDAWQRYFFELLNSDFRPYKTFCTPLQFLEFIGIRPPRRPRTISLLPENWRELLKKGALGEAVAARLGQSYERAIQYYSNQHTLSVAAMTVRANQQANLHTANRNFAHVLVTETYQRFKALEGFERYVYQSLAVDHLQQQLLH